MSIITPGEITIDRSIDGPKPYVILADIRETILVPLVSRDEGDNVDMVMIGESNDFLHEGSHYIDDLEVGHVVILNGGEEDEDPNEYGYCINSSGVLLALHKSTFGDLSPGKIRREISKGTNLRRLGVVYNEQIEPGDIAWMDIQDFIEAFR